VNPPPLLSARLALTLGTLGLDLDLAVGPGQVLALLGPNGAGKTTVLRTLAGLEGVERGRITLDGEVLDDPLSGTFVPPEERPVGVVFQDHLLFPHLRVLDNVAFGPRSRGARRSEARARAGRWLERIGVADLAQSRPAALSGGQAQRVALARALATEPRLLLLDEPLAALDATTRSTVRRDLRRHLDDFGGATVLVTHDPLDALALADGVAILEEGKVTQAGTIAEVTTRPRTPYVADLIGVNLLRGTATGFRVRLDGAAGGAGVIIAERRKGPTLLVFRPQAVSLHRSEPDTSARNQWACTVTGFDLLGDHVRVRLSGDVDLVADLTPASVAELDLVEGRPVWASVKATEITAYAD
jgi:molybdate transport system ATP-binding protein